MEKKKELAFQNDFSNPLFNVHTILHDYIFSP